MRKQRGLTVLMCQGVGYPKCKGKTAEKESAAEYCLTNPKPLCALSVAASLVNCQDKQCSVSGCQEPRWDRDRETNQEGEEEQIEPPKSIMVLTKQDPVTHFPNILNCLGVRSHTSVPPNDGTLSVTLMQQAPPFLSGRASALSPEMIKPASSPRSGS